MQNNIVYNTEEEALRNIGITGGVNTGLNTGTAQYIPGQQQQLYHQQGIMTEAPIMGENVLSNQIGGNPYSNAGLTTGTVITENQYINNTQYATNPQLIADQQFIGGGVPLTGANFPNANLVGTPTGGIYDTNVVGQELLGVGALGVGVVGGQQFYQQQVTGTTTTTGLVPNTALNGSGLGTFVFRPLEARFLKDKDILGKMDSYCKFKIGFHSAKSSVAKSEGTNPVWNDVISLNRKHNEQFAKLKIKDKDRASLNDKVGETKIPLIEVAIKGRVKQWFNVFKKEQLVGEILIDIEFQPRTVF